MATLLETLQKQGQVPGNAGIIDETQKAKTLFQAKSGVAPASIGGPKSSNLGEQAAVDQTNAGLQPVRQQAQLVGQQLESQQANVAQTADQQRATAEAAKRADSISRNIQTDQLLNDLGRDRATLHQQQNQSKLEQVAFGLAMKDKQYVEQLQNEGTKLRLDNALNFKSAMEDDLMAAQQDALQDAIGNKQVMDMGDREFQQAMGSLSIDQIMKMADLDMNRDAAMSGIDAANIKSDFQMKAKQAAIANQASGIDSLIKGGIGAVGAYQNSTSNEPLSNSPATSDRQGGR